MNRLNGFPGVELHAGGVVLSCVWEGKMGDGAGWASGGRGRGTRQTGSKGVHGAGHMAVFLKARPWGAAPTTQDGGSQKGGDRTPPPLLRNHRVVGRRWGWGAGVGNGSKKIY